MLKTHLKLVGGTIAPRPLTATPERRGYTILYSAGMRCPGCGHSAWLVGRSSAECSACATAIPLAPERR